MSVDVKVATERAQARIGSVIKDKWRLDRLLGVGGMACVYAVPCVQMSMERRVPVQTSQQKRQQAEDKSKSKTDEIKICPCHCDRLRSPSRR